MIVRELVTLLGFKVEDEKLNKYEKGIARVKTGIALAGAAVVGLGAVFLKTAGDMEQTQIAFETILGSTQKANKLLDQIAKFAASTPFERTELINYAKSMLGVGWAADDIIPTLNMLGDIASGVGKEKLPNIILAFNKMKAKGRASLEELWPIVEAGVPVLDQLAADLNMTKDQVIKFATEGKLSFETVQKAMKEVEQSKFAGLMIKQSKSFLGIVSNIKDYLVILAGDIGKDLLPGVKEMALEFLNFVETNKEIIKGGIGGFFRGLMYAIGYVEVIVQELIKALGGMDNIMKVVKITFGIVGGIFMGLVKTLWKLRYILLIVIAAIIIYNTILKIQAMAEYIRYLLWFVKAEGAAALAQKILNGTMLLCPLFWIVLGVIAVIAIIWALVANWDKVSAWLKRCWAGIKNAFKSLWNSIWKALDSPWLQTLLTIFFPFIGIPIMIIKNWGKIKKFFSSMWKGVVDTFFWAIRKIKSVWGWLVGGFDKVAVFLHLKPDSKGKKGKQGKPAGKPAGIPAYAAGTDYVPEDQVAFIHKGERILPAGTFNRGSRGNTYIQVTSNPKIQVPPGTPASQAAYLELAARKIFREEWQSILRQTAGAFPIPGTN